MNDRPVTSQPSPWLVRPPGEPVLSGVNWGGLKTLYIKEVRRFFKVQLQTVWAPAITTLLYLAIFTVALGRSGRTVMGEPFADFIAPGLIVMAMLQNAFANASFSLLVGKIQGNIVDYLMPPLSTVRPLPPNATVKMIRNRRVVIAGAQTVCSWTLKKRLTSFT